MLTLLFVMVGSVASTAIEPETVVFGRFGTVTLYRETVHPAHVVLFVSGDGGWNLGVVDMARALASLDALVVGIDITHYLKELGRSSETCSYPAADFEALSQFIQKKLDFPSYSSPLLVGYSSGATLVYATLVQAPPNTFRAAMSLGFCPDLPLSRPLCRGNKLAWEDGPQHKGIRFLPAPGLQTPWVAFQGTVDQVCDPAATEAYVKQVGGAEVVMLPKVGHGFSVQGNWMPQFRQTFSKLVGQAGGPKRPTASSVPDLPLVEVPAPGSASASLAVMLSGDGGWASLDREVAQVLAARGVSVVGLDTLRYFWSRRTPEESAKALERILEQYLAAWQKTSVILAGYSRGADVLPFMVNRLPDEMLSKVSLIALIGPGLTVDFEFHLTEWLLESRGSSARPVMPEVEKLRGRKILCVYGQEEPESLCPRLEKGLAILDPFPGTHHFGGNYEGIARRILQEASG